MKRIAFLFAALALGGTPGLSAAQALTLASRAAPGYDPAEPTVGQFSADHSSGAWSTQVTADANVCGGHYNEAFDANGVHTRDEALKQTRAQVTEFDHKMADIARSCAPHAH